MRYVVVADYWEERKDDIVIFLRVVRFIFRHPNIVVLRALCEVFHDKLLLCLVHAFLCVDVIFCLGVGKVAEMGIEHIAMFYAYVEHFLQSACVVGNMAVGTHNERVGLFLTYVSLHTVYKSVLNIFVRHLHTVVNACASNENARGTNLVAACQAASCHHCGENSQYRLCKYLYHIFLNPILMVVSYFEANWLILPAGRTLSSPKMLLFFFMPA